MKRSAILVVAMLVCAPIYGQERGIVQVKISPQTVEAGQLEPVSFQARALDAAGKEMPATFQWSSSNKGIQVVAPGLVVGWAVGSATIQAVTPAGIMGQATVNVTRKLQGIEISPADATLPLGSMQQYELIGVWEGGQRMQVSGPLVIDHPAVASIDNMRTVRALSIGSTVLRAAINGPGVSFATSTPVRVGPVEWNPSTAAPERGGVLQRIEVAPFNLSVPVGSRVAFAATGIYSDGSRRAVAGTWRSSDRGVAPVDHKGVALAARSGLTTIEFKFVHGEMSATGSSLLTVRN